MTKEKTFSEMLHGDILWMKQQATVDRMRQLGKTEMVLLDTEAAYQYRYEYQYKQHEYVNLITSDLPMMSAFRAGMGYGKGMQAKRKVWITRDLVAMINKRNPACAAELAHGGNRDRYSFNFKTSRMRDWQKINWAYYYGMGEQWKVQTRERN